MHCLPFTEVEVKVTAVAYDSLLQDDFLTEEIFGVPHILFVSWCMHAYIFGPLENIAVLELNKIIVRD